MECPHLPATGYGDFSLGLHQQARLKRIPVTGNFEITERCNLKCVHCYINQAADDRNLKDQELNLAGWTQIMDEVMAEGFLWLTLTGGEPLLRPDFQDIYREAKRRGFLITLFTNGTLITSDIADFLAQWTPFSVEISLYGHTKETYEAVTGVPGSFARCRRGIQLLQDRHIPLGLKAIPMTLNQHELPEMQAWAQSMGKTLRYDPLINCRLDGSTGPCHYRLTPEQVVALDLADEARAIACREMFSKPSTSPASGLLYRCGAAAISFHINPYGDLSGCIMVREPAVRLPGTTFKAGWEEVLSELRTQKYSSHNQCLRCPWLDKCSQCPGYGMLEMQAPDGIVDYLCRITHLRAEIFDLQQNPKESKSWS